MGLHPAELREVDCVSSVFIVLWCNRLSEVSHIENVIARGPTAYVNCRRKRAINQRAMIRAQVTDELGIMADGGEWEGAEARGVGEKAGAVSGEADAV